MKAREIFIVTESNPNTKDLDWQTLLKTTLFENEKDCENFVDTLIENYINLYVECWNDYPKTLNFSDKENNFYVDRFTWYLEWWNIVVKKSIWTF